MTGTGELGEDAAKGRGVISWRHTNCIGFVTSTSNVSKHVAQRVLQHVVLDKHGQTTGLGFLQESYTPNAGQRSRCIESLRKASLGIKYEKNSLARESGWLRAAKGHFPGIWRQWTCTSGRTWQMAGTKSNASGEA